MEGLKDISSAVEEHLVLVPRCPVHPLEFAQQGVRHLVPAEIPVQQWQQANGALVKQLDIGA
jgi:hypothetical protein